LGTGLLPGVMRLGRGWGLLRNQRRG